LNFGAFILSTLSIAIGKTAVMAVTALLLWRVIAGLRGRAAARLASFATPAVKTIGWLFVTGLACFAFSEVVCAVEIYVVQQPNPTLRVGHGFASALGTGLLVYASLLAVDRVALHYVDQERPCILVGACQGCPRRVGLRCRPHTLFFLTTLLLTLMTLPLLFIVTRPLAADPAAVTLPCEHANAFYDQALVPLLAHVSPSGASLTPTFAIPEAASIVEFRVIPLAALALGVLALILSLLRGRENVALALSCLTCGMLGYCYLEAAVYVLIPAVYVGALGHEIAELVGLLVLRRVLYDFVGSPPARQYVSS